MSFVAAEKQWVAGRTWRERLFNVINYGAVGDGVTDDTDAIQSAIDACAAAGGGRVVLPARTYLVAGPLKDVAGANAQIVLPVVHYVAQPQIAVVLEGEIPAPITYSVIGNAPAASKHTIIKSTLAGPGNVIGAYGPEGAYARFTNLLVDVRNLTVRMPPNPQGVALNLWKVSQARIDGVSVDTGDYSVDTLTEPTYSTSFGLRVPSSQNGAFTSIGSFAACGVYNCIEVAEHTNAIEITSYGCKVAVYASSAGVGHTNHIQRLNSHHQPYGVVVVGRLRMDIANYNIEHAFAGSWRTSINDISDPGNLWRGSVRYGIGSADKVWRKIGGASVTAVNIDGTNIDG